MQTLGARAVAGAWCMARLVAWAIIIIMAMGPGAIINIYACAPLIDGLGLETQTASTSYLSHVQASCVIVSRPVYSSAGLGYISP